MRTLLVSNRLPVSFTRGDAGFVAHRSSGGLATGLGDLHDAGTGWWIGWPGEPGDATEAERTRIAADLARSRMLPVWLTPGELEGYYENIANRALWPLFHYLIEQIPLHIRDWDVYERVNERFAAAVASVYQPGDRIWVHDYHLLLVPDLLRRRFPEATIGFFLHIPFPASEVFRALPFRERVLEGLLGSDLIGFHTAAYARHFNASVLRILGLAPRVGHVQVGRREVQIGVFPMGVDAKQWEALGTAEAAPSDVVAFRGDEPEALVLGVDRLDYTKGIPRRLLAFEQLLEKHPELHGRVRLVQLAVPSRSTISSYEEFRVQIESLVGRVNGRYGTPQWMPIHYLYRSLTQAEVAALYRAADVLLVTPVRDGMNLVAKEFIASRIDEDGVLVLSEFTGAASELAEAVHVNPFDVDRTADAIHRALTMPPEERRARMQALRHRVSSFDVHRWARRFLDSLASAARVRATPDPAPTDAARLDAMLARVRAAERLVLLLDYDGTLVGFAEIPELAFPDPDLLALLRRLVSRPRTTVHLVSGRGYATLDRWFGALPIGLHAEHGAWSRVPGGGWEAMELSPQPWREKAREILEDYRARTPGSLLEEKASGLAWHYRWADPEFGSFQANELRLHLSEVLSNEPVEILPGEKVIELRPHGVHKGLVVAQVLAKAGPDALIVALGDDRTDEELFAALPPDAISLHVGPGASIASHRISDWRDVRRFLEGVVAGDS